MASPGSRAENQLEAGSLEFRAHRLLEEEGCVNVTGATHLMRAIHVDAVLDAAAWGPDAVLGRKTRAPSEVTRGARE